MTILGLLGFSVSKKYWMLFLIAVPYGLLEIAYRQADANKEK